VTGSTISPVVAQIDCDLIGSEWHGQIRLPLIEVDLTSGAIFTGTFTRPTLRVSFVPRAG
jgi:hypothetical protein